MSDEIYFRFEVSGVGIFATVDIDCPEADERRENKPDGSWLVKAGVHYKEGISYWTPKGLSKYIESGLMFWHNDVTNERVTIKIAKLKSEPLYKDNFQVIALASEFDISEIHPLADFLESFSTVN